MLKNMNITLIDDTGQKFSRFKFRMSTDSLNNSIDGFNKDKELKTKQFSYYSNSAKNIAVKTKSFLPNLSVDNKNNQKVSLCSKHLELPIKLQIKPRAFSSKKTEISIIDLKFESKHNCESDVIMTPKFKGKSFTKKSRPNIPHIPKMQKIKLPMINNNDKPASPIIKICRSLELNKRNKSHEVKNNNTNNVSNSSCNMEFTFKTPINNKIENENKNSNNTSACAYELSLNKIKILNLGLNKSNIKAKMINLQNVKKINLKQIKIIPSNNQSNNKSNNSINNTCNNSIHNTDTTIANTNLSFKTKSDESQRLSINLSESSIRNNSIRNTPILNKNHPQMKKFFESN